MEKFNEKNLNKNNDVLDIGAIKSVLATRVNLENIQNFRYIIEQISSNFNKAVDCEDKNDIKPFLDNIKRHESYLGEKYRDTREEKDYIKTVNQAINFLENKL